MIEKIALYFITLFIYIAWLFYAVKTNKIKEFPIISACFLGFFVFNALGSILIMFPNTIPIPRENYFSYDYILMLNIQAIIFYTVTSIYFYIIKKLSHQKKILIKTKITDSVFLYSIFGITVLLLLIFFSKIGSPPLVELLMGNLSSRNEIIDYRTQVIYSVNARFSSLVFDILPMFVSCYAFLKTVSKKRNIYDYIIIASCILISTLPGGKGSILNIAIALFFAYLISQGESFYAPRKIISIKWAFSLFSSAFIPVLLLYNVYYGSEFNIFEQLKLLLYRIIGVYSESLAATVTYAEEFGFINGNTLPNLKGFLTHEPIQISKEMHIFLFNSNRGNAPISALAEGYINFGWFGFILFAFITFLTVIGIQQILSSMPRNLFTLSLTVIYGIMATRVAQTGLFITLLSLTYLMLFCLLFLMRAILVTLFKCKPGVNLGKTAKLINLDSSTTLK